jgi:hypothetical protein
MERNKDRSKPGFWEWFFKFSRNFEIAGAAILVALNQAGGAAIFGFLALIDHTFGKSLENKRKNQPVS